MISRNMKMLILASMVVAAILVSVGFGSKALSIDSITSFTSRPPVPEATVVIRPENSPKSPDIDIQLPTAAINLDKVKSKSSQIHITILSNDDRALPLQIRVFNNDSEEGQVMSTSDLKGLPNGLPDGITVTPDVTKLTLDPHGRSQVVVNVIAMPNAPAGTYNIGVTVRAVVGVIDGIQVEDATTKILTLTVS